MVAIADRTSQVIEVWGQVRRSPLRTIHCPLESVDGPVQVLRAFRMAVAAKETHTKVVEIGRQSWRVSVGAGDGALESTEASIEVFQLPGTIVAQAQSNAEIIQTDGKVGRA